MISQNEKRIMIVFGTRPEAIKMCPLVKELKKRDAFQVTVCVTAQHRQMLDQVLETFDVIPDYDLNIMKPKQSLFDITINVLGGIKNILEEVHPDVVLVHGDTSLHSLRHWRASICKYRSGMWKQDFAPTIFTVRILRNSTVRE